MRYLLFVLFYVISAAASITDVERSELAFKNVLRNPGFENGIAGWTASGGALASVTSGSNLLTGKVSATWNSDGAGQTLTSSAITVPNGLLGRNGLAQCKILVPSGTGTHTISVTDGTNTLVSSSIISSSTPSVSSLNFIFPSSGTVAIRLTSVASDEPLITIDDCYLGEALNLSSVSQANFIGSAFFATTANCEWTRSSTALGAFSTDADCPAPTVELNPGPGTIQATDADLPQFTVNNLPPGDYMVVINARSVATSGVSASLAINDGTSTRGRSSFKTSTAGTIDVEANTIVANFSYSTAGNRTFALWGSSTSLSVSVSSDIANAQLTFAIYRYPSTSEQSYTPDKLANSWSGYHDSTCSWARTNTAYGDPTADATCALVQRENQSFGTVTSALSGGNALPGIVFTPSRAGRYFVCAKSTVLIATSGADVAVRLWDGTKVIGEDALEGATSGGTISSNICGSYSITSTAPVTLTLQTKSSTGAATIQTLTNTSATEWSIFQIDQSMPMPAIVNSVTNSSNGITRIEAASLNCDSGSTILSQVGSWVSSIGNNSSGACSVTLNSGIFSQAPICTISSILTGNPGIMSITVTSSTALTIRCYSDTAGICTIYNVHVLCYGLK